MVLVAPSSKPFDLTAKGTPRRGFVLASYEKEIEQAYEAVKESSQSDVTAPSHWGSDEVLEYIRNVIQKTLREAVGDDADLFQHGCDRCDDLIHTLNTHLWRLTLIWKLTSDVDPEHDSARS
jgi:hypothetical protein